MQPVRIDTIYTISTCFAIRITVLLVLKDGRYRWARLQSCTVATSLISRRRLPGRESTICQQRSATTTTKAETYVAASHGVEQT